MAILLKPMNWSNMILTKKKNNTSFQSDLLMNYLQQNIAFIRKIKKLTYLEFGEQVEATEGMMKSYELKGATPPVEILCAIADYAGLSLDALIREQLTEKNYSILNHPQPSPGAVKKLQFQIDLLVRRVASLERKADGRQKAKIHR